MGVLASPDIPDELPPLVVSLDDHLDLGVEVAVGQADHQALLSRGYGVLLNIFFVFFHSIHLHHFSI